MISLRERVSHVGSFDDGRCKLDPNCVVHETMLGLTRTDAGSDLVSVHRKRSVATKHERDPEEWTGIGS